MVEQIINSMQNSIDELKNAINLDIEDIKASRHEELFGRNEIKNQIINSIMSKKIELNNELSKLIQANFDVNIYREQVNNLEENLKDLYELNKKLASIVLPIKQMYKELIDEISEQGGGQIFDIKA